MCVNGRFVTNRYTGQQFWSECGRCPACLQKKAAMRANRIRNEYSYHDNLYFVTLTYDRLSVPYVKLDDYLNLKSDKCFQELNVYRKCDVKWSVGKRKYVRSYKPVILQKTIIDDPSVFTWLDGNGRHHSFCKTMTKQTDKISVIYFKDIQDFKKRLRINLKRLYNYDKTLRIFNVSEYGGKNLRSHHHLLIYGEGLSQVAFHDAVIKSWPYGRRVRNEESCQLVTDDPAGYVASYVNCGENLSPLLSRYFKQRHSSSKFFGHHLSAFSLAKIQEKALKGDMQYSSFGLRNGIPTINDFLLPKYVINRFFPLFKGYSRLTGHEICEFLSRGCDVNYLAERAERYNEWCSRNGMTKFSIIYEPARYNAGKFEKPSDLYLIRQRLFSAFNLYKETYPYASWFDYAKIYDQVWKSYRSTAYKRFVQDSSISDFFKYDNICMLPRDRQLSLFRDLARFGDNFPCHDKSISSQFTPNDYSHVKSKTMKLTSFYYKYCKQKECTGAILNAAGIDDM